MNGRVFAIDVPQLNFLKVQDLTISHRPVSYRPTTLPYASETCSSVSILLITSADSLAGRICEMHVGRCRAKFIIQSCVLGWPVFFLSNIELLVGQ